MSYDTFLKDLLKSDVKLPMCLSEESFVERMEFLFHEDNGKVIKKGWSAKDRVFLLKEIYGLEGVQQETMVTISKRCGLSRERIRQIKNGSIRMLLQIIVNRYPNIDTNTNDWKERALKAFTIDSNITMEMSKLNSTKSDNWSSSFKRFQRHLVGNESGDCEFGDEELFVKRMEFLYCSCIVPDVRDKRSSMDRLLMLKESHGLCGIKKASLVEVGRRRNVNTETIRRLNIKTIDTFNDLIRNFYNVPKGLHSRKIAMNAFLSDERILMEVGKGSSSERDYHLERDILKFKNKKLNKMESIS